jgi:hypothetical protein
LADHPLNHNVLDIFCLRVTLSKTVGIMIRVWNGTKEPTNINKALGLSSLTGDFSRKHVFSGPRGINSARCFHRVLYSKLSGVKGSHNACEFVVSDSKT